MGLMKSGADWIRKKKRGMHMRRKMRVGCLALSALLLLAPGASLAVRAETPNAALFAENADTAVTPESVEGLIAQIGDVTPKKADAIAKAWNAYS